MTSAPTRTQFVSREISDNYSHRTIEGRIGHDLPQEAPEAFAEAVLDVDEFD